MCWGGTPSCAGKDNGNEDSEYAKSARLSDQITAGTGSRVAEGCLKQGHLHLAAETDLSSCDSWRTFLLKRRWWHLHFVGDDKTRVGQGLTLASELSKELPK